MHSVAYLRPAQSGAGVSTTVDSTGDVGQYTSIRIGTDGLGLISYYEVGKNNNTLKVLHCGNTICNSGNTSTTVDNSGNAGMYSSIAIGADGLGLISYFDAGSLALKVLHCGNTACSSGNTTALVDASGAPGQYTSITIGTDKLGLISYYNSFPPGALNVFHCSNTACNSGTVSTVDSSSTFENTSIGIGADGQGLISYHDAGNNTLKVLHCGNTICNSGNTSTTVDSTAGKYSSITIGADGLGLISYFDAGHVALKVLHCGNTACSSGNTSALVDASGAPGQYTSITIGADGLGLISYFNSFPPGSLNVFHCNNTACNGGIVDKLDVGEYTSIGIGADGLGLISYYDVSNGDLKVFHCSNRLCSFATVFLPLVIK